MKAIGDLFKFFDPLEDDVMTSKLGIVAYSLPTWNILIKVI